MIQKRNLRKRYVFFVMLLFAILLHRSPRTVFAENRTVRLTETAAGTADTELPAEQLFTKAVYPGSRETCVLTIVNNLSQSVSLRLEAPAADANALYEALHFTIRSGTGVLYEGPPGGLNLLLREIPRHGKQKLELTMELPREADRSVAGLQTSFRFRLSGTETGAGDSGNTSGNHAAANGQTQNSGSSGTGGSPGNGGSGGSNSGGSNSGGSSGTGLKGVTPGTGSTAGVSADGYPIIYDSPYIRIRPANAGGSGAGSSGGSTMGSGAGSSGSRRSGLAGRDGAGGGEAKLYPEPDLMLTKGCDTGNWEPTRDGSWQYRFADGKPAAGGFLFAKNPYHSSGPEYEWFYMDANGQLVTGWIRNTETCWYHAHEASDGDRGALEIGWLDEPQDGRSYYLRETDAKMAAGWVGFAERSKPLAVDYYYFAALTDTHRQNWFQRSAFGRWIYDRLGFRSYGSLYAAETTPDGSRVDANGRKQEVSR